MVIAEVSGHNGTAYVIFRIRPIRYPNASPQILCRITTQSMLRNMATTSTSTEYPRQHPCQHRHNGKLSQTSHNHIARAAEHHFEVIELKSEAHSEHDYAKQRVDHLWLDVAEYFGKYQSYYRGEQYQNSHVF